jgi:hypothetical protein
MGLNVQNFQTFDMTNQSVGHVGAKTTGNTLQLGLSDVLSENGGLGIGSAAHPLMVLGDTSATSPSASVVQLDGTSSLAGSNWSLSPSTTVVGSDVFDVYRHSTNSAAELLIQHGANITVI